MKNNEYDFYNQTKNWDFTKIKYDTIEFTDWNMYKILKNITNQNSKVLDLGTGGGEKLLNEFPTNVKEILGTDFSIEMIETANNNLKKSNRNNVKFRVMNNLNMDTPKNYYDVVVARHTVTDPSQIYETLKDGGYLLIKGVDKYDCQELKKVFGKEAIYDKKPISIIDYENVLDAGFNDVELVPLHVVEYYKTKEDLLGLLLKVPILNDFNEEKEEIDMEKLDKYIKRNTYEKGIKLIRRYYGITGKK